MNSISIEIGKKIRNFRKGKGLTITQLGTLISKSKATVSKYEKGEITVDIVTLYDIAKALNINVEQLLFIDPQDNQYLSNDLPTTYFKNSNRYYTYYYDGRNNKLVRGLIDVYEDPTVPKYKTIFYMNVKSFEEYESCENTYIGYTEHYDSLSIMFLKNQATPIEKLTIKILAPFLETNRKWGLMCGVSFRPLMPIALKILISKDILIEDNALISDLQITKEDIRLMKIFNMFCVT